LVLRNKSWYYKNKIWY